MKINYLNKAKLVVIDNKKYIQKQRKRNILEVYNELENRGFSNYVKLSSYDDQKEVYEYIDNITIIAEEKAKDIISLASILHTKTTSFNNISEEEIKKIYESVIDKIDTTYKYYSNLQNEIEEHIYMSPAEIVLMNNISKVYYLLSVSRSRIELFFEDLNTSKKVRKSIIHGNLKLDHLVESTDKYLISWNASRVDIPIYDLENLFKNEYQSIEFLSLYNEYQKKYKLLDYEENLFIALLTIPDIITFTKDNLISTIKTVNLVQYIDKCLNFILDKDKENQESNE